MYASRSSSFVRVLMGTDVTKFALYVDIEDDKVFVASVRGDGDPSQLIAE